MTAQMLSKFERARVIGARAVQLSAGAPPLIEVSGQSSPVEVAMKELESGIIPLIVLRQVV